MAHDFEKFPELTNRQMQIYYWESPHKQILDDIQVRVVEVLDGDTIRVTWRERDFAFRVRLADIAAPEENEGGKESKEHLESLILNQDVHLDIDPNNRVGKWGRLIATALWGGFNVNEEMVRSGNAVRWQDRKSTFLPDFGRELKSHFK